MEWMLLPFRRYADFRGRSRRMEFWMFQLLNVIVWFVIMAIGFSGFPWGEMMSGDAAQVEAQMQGMDGIGAGFWVAIVLAGLWGLGTFIPALALTVRRLHDRGLSGWWYAGAIVLSLIPLVNILAFFAYIALFVIFVLPGERGPNKWGPDPKDPGQASVFE